MISPDELAAIENRVKDDSVGVYISKAGEDRELLLSDNKELREAIALIDQQAVVKAALEMAAALCGSKMTADNIRSITVESVLARVGE